MSSFEKNKDYTIKIENCVATGEGIGRVDGAVMFVPDSVPGDVLSVKAVKVNKNHAFGKIMKIIEPSEFRAQPQCPSHKRCGGCSFMHIAYQQQLEIKKHEVSDAINRIGGFRDAKIADVVGMDNPFRYRNKIQMPVGLERDGKLVSGFFAKRSHEIIPIEDCKLAHISVQGITQIVKEHMLENNVKPYNEQSHTGVVRNIFIRNNAKGEMMVGIVVNGGGIKNENELAQKIVKENGNVKSIVININKKKTNLVLGEQNRFIYGENGIVDSIGGISVKISPNSFYQVNHAQAEKLYRKGKELLNLAGTETVFDLYSGIGSIGLFVADKAKHVIGVEVVPEAVENARENAKQNKIENAEFYLGAVEEIVPKLYEQGHRADVVILDPPRKGADEQLLETIKKMNPEKILYISCNPATLARDLKILTEGTDYKFDTVYPFDLFPHTPHVECVVLMTQQHSEKVKE